MVSAVALGAMVLSMPAMALANVPEDEIGSAATIYQTYVEDGATGQISFRTNVAGESPEIERYLDQTVDLATRLVPFSYDVSLTYIPHQNPTSASVSFRNREYNDQNSEVMAIVRDVVRKAKETGKNDYELLQYFNRYLVGVCEYDSNAATDPERYFRSYTAYGCLVDGKAVCEGYTNAMLLLCEEAKIPCIKVIGKANGGNHIWNAVNLDDKWWMLDVTFNDPMGNQTEPDHWTYFLKDIDTFQRYGLHVYSEAAYMTSKEIYTGRMQGQKEIAFPHANLSTQDAVLGDSLDEFRQKQTIGIPATMQETEPEAIVDNQTPDQPTDTESLSLEDKANLLKEAGLFMGDERGFRLDEPMNRVEMGVMVMRMNRGQKELAAASDFYAGQSPFTDVPKWAASTIGYLYAKKLVAGMGETTFGTGNVTKQDYAVMMLRVLKIDHTYADAVDIAVDHGIMTEEMAKADKVATRGDVVYMTYATETLDRTTIVG